ncbi:MULTISPECIES: LacI family DNA-binding transcriptional regulator [unclassified Mesorhizobium]|uniref:LacI family DNA-binding transcriptional regulator n=1 Tax=unclassified Mesorhizobium TaxID=325217 RepID=UPI002414DE73|nr:MULTISPECIES: LacI family DNA-binding transcriptional regulator [unclassified Mesorhizobium]MDG4889983.1 LacI family DNA-binding transcriptional regulator [Mesorhizobium sp. WSM4887]MDG4904125.1 LacI family DNA-binding transcriptional regulator [Mesorhizobium sp. WSM4962]MDG4909152.1 LacI family DNA-binding transcriptional regulator [Mesorhizobium sp. WSM4898]MDG4921776.1 LacI family DNA-binding transcriptional regulator [Mesorhizobium sp. WSM4989]
MGRVTIQDVARTAGVSATSISNFFNNRLHHMRPETKERIEQAIKQLGYVPSHAALQLKTGKTPMIGLLVPTVANAFFGELAVAMEQAAKEQGFRIILCNTLQDASNERDFWVGLSALGVRGVICSSALVTNDELAGYVKMGLCVVAVDEKQLDQLPPSVDFVSIDHRKAIRLAVDHLVMLGHRRIAYIADFSTTTFSRRSKAEGFLEAVASHGLEDCHLVMPDASEGVPRFSGKELAELGRAGVNTILLEHPKSTAIVTFNDMTALGAIEALKERQISVPDQISVVGIDGISVGELLAPTITSVRQPLELSAREAIGCITEQLEGGRKVRKDVSIEPQLLVRKSSGPPP